MHKACPRLKSVHSVPSNRTIAFSRSTLGSPPRHLGIYCPHLAASWRPRGPPAFFFSPLSYGHFPFFRQLLHDICPTSAQCRPNLPNRVHSWPILGPSWPISGPSWPILGPSWRNLGLYLGSQEAQNGAPAVAKRHFLKMHFFHHRTHFLAHFWPTLGLSWTARACLGPILAPSWPHLGPMLTQS